MCGRVNLLPPERTVCLMFMFTRNTSKKLLSVEAFMETGCRLIFYKNKITCVCATPTKYSQTAMCTMTMYNEGFHK